MTNNRKRLTGRVVSDKMDKTVTVLIERRKMHRIYKKVVVTSKKVLAHDETNEVPLGAIVRIVESRPMSKRKRWAVEEVLETPADVEHRKQEARHASQQAKQAARAQAEAEEETIEEAEDDTFDSADASIEEERAEVGEIPPEPAQIPDEDAVEVITEDDTGLPGTTIGVILIVSGLLTGFFAGIYLLRQRRGN